MVYSIPLYSIFLFTYPLVALVMWKLLVNENKMKEYIHRAEDQSFTAIDITIKHSVLLTIAIVSFMLVNKVVSEWYFAFKLYNYVTNYTVYSELLKLVLLVAVVWLMLVESYIIYKTKGIEYFSVTLHSLGLIGTLICYMYVLATKVNIVNYGRKIIWCEGVYVEAIFIALIFLVRYSDVKREYKDKVRNSKNCYKL